MPVAGSIDFGAVVPNGEPGRFTQTTKYFVEIDRLAVADQAVPPARLLLRVVAVPARGVRARGERVTDQDGVRAIRVQLAERLVDDRERRDGLPVRKRKPSGSSSSSEARETNDMGGEHTLRGAALL